MIINSISADVSAAVHAGNSAKTRDVSGNEPTKIKVSGNKSSTANPIGSTAAELAISGQSQSAGGDDSNPPVPLVVNGLGLGLKFSLDKETNTQLIEVIDLKSGDIVRQIPPKEVLNFLRAMRDNKGILLSRSL